VHDPQAEQAEPAEQAEQAEPAEPAGRRASDQAETCSGCGTRAESLPLTWTAQSGPRGATWLCERCTRENLRSIEGRLDEAWW
jgi:hypothetical protein